MGNRHRGKIATLNYQSFSETLLTPENTRIVVELPYEDGVYWVWDRENHTLSPSFTGDEQFFMGGAIFSPDGTRFITHDDRWAYLWDTITETMMKRLAPYEDYPNPIDAVSLFTPQIRVMPSLLGIIKPILVIPVCAYTMQ
ncbi:MAG: hypothetical protein SFZ02_14755 [bacterium]|nr:hypothetical protein [bacterium]